MKDLSHAARQTEEDKIGSKEKILEAAMGEFAKNGLQGARVDKIAAEAGVNKAMIYYHFSSKAKLYNEVVHNFVASRITMLQRDISNEVRLEDAVRQALDFHAEMFHNNPQVISIFLRELATPGSEIIATVANVIKGAGLPAEFSKKLSNGMRSGEFRPVDVRQAMISLMTMSIGYFLMSQIFDNVWQVTGEPAFIEERKKAIVDLFMNGVKAR